MESLERLRAAQDYVFYGQIDRGKTHLAIALGTLAVNAGKSVRYFLCAQLVLMPQRARKKGRLEAVHTDIGKADLVILDEFGYISLDSQGARPLFQIMSMSYETRGLIATMNIELSRRNAVLADEKLAAAAAVDRFIDHDRLVEFEGINRRVERSLMPGKSK